MYLLTRHIKEDLGVRCRNWVSGITYIDAWYSVHCKDIVPKIGNKYFQEWNCTASFPIPPFPTFMYLWAIYIFPWMPRLFVCSKVGEPIIGIYNSLTNECRNWKRGRAVSFLQVHKSNLVCSVGIMQCKYCKIVTQCLHLPGRCKRWRKRNDVSIVWAVTW